jgi:Flp pilus assembly protein TadD
MLTEAEKRRPQLVARIVLNHPALYDSQTVSAARGILGDDAPARYATTLAAARAKVATGDVPGAIALVDAFLRTAPHFAEAHNDLAVLWRASGDLRRAAAAIVQALELAPRSPPIRQNALAIRQAAEAAVPALRSTGTEPR